MIPSSTWFGSSTEPTSTAADDPGRVGEREGSRGRQPQEGKRSKVGKNGGPSRHQALLTGPLDRAADRGKTRTLIPAVELRVTYRASFGQSWADATECSAWWRYIWGSRGPGFKSRQPDHVRLIPWVDREQATVAS